MLETRTLVLDDDPPTVEVLARCLHDTVRTVDQALEPARALELFALHRHAVVVLDLNLPEMDGFEVMHRIHQIEPCTQVIIVTGHRSFERAQEAVNRHAFGFFLKPFAFEDLRRSVIAAFAHYQERSIRAEHRVGERDETAFEAAAEIEALYQDVASCSRALERSPGDVALQAAYRDSFARLRSAQTREADLASRAFRDHLALENGMGYSSIEAARRVLDRDKGSS
jgi:DNA-binding NtrC family response regulator